MESIFLLFEKKFNGKPLFKSQLDLVLSLLNDRETAYFINEEETELYTKAQSRLKTYISQLLSSNVTRNITEDFKNGLIIIISKKLTQEEVQQQVDLIIDDLKKKNSISLRHDLKASIIEQFYSDFYSGNYIAIITSKPLEVESEVQSNDFSLRKVFFKDFFECLISEDKDFKNYRFNFPLESSGILFWKGLRKVLKKYLRDHLNDSLLFTALYSKFAIKTKTFKDILEKNNFTEEHLREVVDEILLLLNRNRNIMVFIGHAPIFAIPIVAINPAESKNIKLYALLDIINPEINIHKYSNEDVVLWRLFVWDKLKSKEYAGLNCFYSKDL